MSEAARAWAEGVQRVLHAPRLLAGVYVLTLVSALPLAIVVRGAIIDDLGNSVAAVSMAQGVDWAWWEEFQARASGIARTLTPSVIGFAAVLHNLSAFLDGHPLDGPLITALTGYLAGWAFLVGGILDRLARQRPVATGAFFSACGTYFFRFCRLAVVAGATYWVLVGPLHNWLFNDLFPALTRDLTVERTAFAIRIALYALFLTLLVAANLVFDYAKIRAVVEDRRSMVGAVLAAMRFVRRRPLATIGLYALNGMAFMGVLALYAVAAPGAGTDAIWTALLVGQVYVAARLFIKLVFLASQTAYFQRQLAHASYVAAPLPVWPESPAAEAITGTSRQP